MSCTKSTMQIMYEKCNIVLSHAFKIIAMNFKNCIIAFLWSYQNKLHELCIVYIKTEIRYVLGVNILPNWLVEAQFNISIYIY